MVLVVGAGIIGCAIARELAVRGVACTIADDRPVAGGATQASAGILAPYVEAHEDSPLLPLAVRSLDMYPGWITAVRRESQLDVEFDTIGTLEVADTPERATSLRAHGGAHGRWLAAEDVATSYPYVTPAAGAVFTAAHGYVAAPQLANALAHSAAAHGASFHRGRVVGVRRDGSTFVLTTTAGELRAGRVIVAAGAWANAIDGVRVPPVRPVRGQILQLRWPGSTLMTVVWGSRCYVVPRLDRSVLVGATVEEAGFDDRTTAGGVRGLLDAACDLLPELERATFLDARAGLRPATPDGLPAIGEDPQTPGVFYAVGHYRNGILLAPITAKLVADLVVDGSRDACLESFRVDRFR